MTIGNLIEKKRKELGLTQEELARKVGYTSKTTVSKIESDAIDLPRSKITVFSNVLGIPVNDFFSVNDSSQVQEIGELCVPFIPSKLTNNDVESIMTSNSIEYNTINIFKLFEKSENSRDIIGAVVYGDSMDEEGLVDGDMVFFQKGYIDQEGLYVLSYAGDVLVKRLVFDKLKGTIDILSSHKGYSIKTVNASDVVILGKVVGSIHSYR